MLTTHGNHCREEPILTPWWIYLTDFNLYFSLLLLLCHYCLVTNSCPTLCDPMDCSTPGSSFLHYLPEFAWTHVHWVSGNFQPSHPVAPFSCPKSFPVSGSFLITWLFFPNSSPSKESTCNAWDLGSVLGWEDTRRREWIPTSVFWPGEFYGLYSPWVTKSWTQLSHFHFTIPSGGQIIGGSASASVPPMNIQSWFPLRLTGCYYNHS